MLGAKQEARGGGVSVGVVGNTHLLSHDFQTVIRRCPERPAFSALAMEALGGVGLVLMRAALTSSLDGSVISPPPITPRRDANCDCIIYGLFLRSFCLYLPCSIDVWDRDRNAKI